MNLSRETRNVTDLRCNLTFTAYGTERGIIKLSLQDVK